MPLRISCRTVTKTIGPAFPVFLRDPENGGCLLCLVADLQRAVKHAAAAGPHAPLQGDGRQEAAAPRMTVGTDLGHGRQRKSRARPRAREARRPRRRNRVTPLSVAAKALTGKPRMLSRRTSIRPIQLCKVSSVILFHCAALQGSGNAQHVRVSESNLQNGRRAAGLAPPKTRRGAAALPLRPKCRRCRSGQIETVEFHHLVPGRDEIRHELRLAVAAAIDLARARSCEFDPNTRSTRVAVHFSALVLRSRSSKTSSAADVAFQTLPMSSRLTKKSLVSVPASW